MGSQIPDEGNAGPQSQLNDAWMIKSQKGRMPGLHQCTVHWHGHRSPASSGCGLHGRLLGKPQGCKQEEPNVFQPPFHMFGHKSKYLYCSTCFSNIFCEYETGDWNCTTKVCSVICWSLVCVPSNKAAFTSQICLHSSIFANLFPKSLPPDKHIRSIPDVNPVDEDFSNSVEPFTVELNLGRLEL